MHVKLTAYLFTFAVSDLSHITGQISSILAPHATQLWHRSQSTLLYALIIWLLFISASRRAICCLPLLYILPLIQCPAFTRHSNIYWLNGERELNYNLEDEKKLHREGDIWSGPWSGQKEKRARAVGAGHGALWVFVTILVAWVWSSVCGVKMKRESFSWQMPVYCWM